MDTKEQNDIDVGGIVARLEEVQSKAKQLEEETRKLEADLKIARGTGDHAETAAEAMRQARARSVTREQLQLPVVATRPAALRDRIKTALLRESLTINQMAKALGENTAKISDEMRTLRSEGQVYNVGNADNPMWTWRIGDNTETRVLLDTVRRLIAERPMTTRELAEATGARLSRVGGVMVAIQRSTDQIFNLGDKKTARWFLASGAKPANLPPKRKGF